MHEGSLRHAVGSGTRNRSRTSLGEHRTQRERAAMPQNTPCGNGSFRLPTYGSEKPADPDFTICP
jgi:hypothetical protein